MTATVQEYQFQAETKQLLDLMIHSLYTSKDIAIRELISNASDAIDRLRFEALSDPSMIGDDDKFEIRLDPDREARTLTITDNGVGMSREDVVNNIGTIAKSGTRELRERIRQGESSAQLAELIGQFGVGFYSAFMIADKVTMVTRRAGESAATKWESTGDGRYTIEPAEKEGRGTSIILHLKPVDTESGIEDYADRWVVSRIVKRYSDFVNYPIISREEREEPERDADGKVVEGAPKKTVVEDKTLNSMKPIWIRSQSEVTQEEYNEFYRHVSHDWNEPMRTISLKAEGTTEYQALLFIPSKAPFDLFFHGAEMGLRLYARRVLIMEKCEELMPRYLRFMKGIVDSADLPLNISRQMLQQDRHIVQIRKWLTKKVLDTLQEIKEKEYDKYLQFWKEFGRAIKEGVGSDYDNKDRILPLLLFESSNDPEKLTTLADYVGRMKPDQTEIYYLTGESRHVVENSPHLEAFKENGYEVLYMIDPVDEMLVESIPDFESKALKSVIKGTVKLGSEAEKEQAEKERKEKEDETRPLLDFLQKHLEESIKEVRLSNRLVSSPVCLVGADMDYSPQLERLLQSVKGAAGPRQKRIMELNPRHPIFEKMNARFNQDAEDKAIGDYAELLLGYALLAEGSELPDPVKFNRLVVDLMEKSL